MLKSRLSLLAVLCLHLLLVPTVQSQSSRILWVSTDGSNSNAGSYESPFRNIQFAINNASDKDTIILKPGAYVEKFTFWGPKALTLASQYLLNCDSIYINNTSIESSSAMASWDGLIRSFTDAPRYRSAIIGVTIQKVTGPIFELNFADLRKVIVKNNDRGTGSPSGNFGSFTNSTIDSCAFTDNGLTTLYYTSIELSNSTLKNSLVKNNKVALAVFQLKNGNTIENNRFYDNGSFYIGANSGHAFSLYASAGNTRIVNNEFVRNLRGGIRAGDYGDNLLIANNTFYGNGSGIDIGASSSSTGSLLLYNNLIAGNKNSDIGIIEGSSSVRPTVVCKNNVIGYSFTSLADIPNINAVDTTGSENNYGFYPEYRDSAKGDFRLSGTSRALGKGTMELATSYDLFGNARPAPAGSNPDIGANESPLGKATSLFTFSGSGDWNDPVNWQNSTVPQLTLSEGHVVIIDPSGNGECIVDQPVIVNPGSSLEVKPGKKLILRK